MPISTREDVLKRFEGEYLRMLRITKDFETSKKAQQEVQKQRDAQRVKLDELKRGVENYVLEDKISNMAELAERILNAKLCLKAYEKEWERLQNEIKDQFARKVEADKLCKEAAMDAYVTYVNTTVKTVPTGSVYWDSRAKAWSYSVMTAGPTQGGKSVVTPTPPPVTPSVEPRFLSEDGKNFVRGRYKHELLSEVVRKERGRKYITRILSNPDMVLDMRDRSALDKAMRGETHVPKEPKTTTKDRFLSDDDLQFIKGKHAGAKLSYCHERYVRWLLRNCELDKKDFNAFEAFLTKHFDIAPDDGNYEFIDPTHDDMYE